MDYEVIIKEADKNNKLSENDRILIKTAYTFADKAHHGQKRKSGQPYISHCYETALSVAKWGLDATTISAALLHDVAEDTEYTMDSIREAFGEEIAFLVDGVTKISRLKYRGNQAQAETLKKMIFALSKDIRVVFIKLADRLHNMTTLNALPPVKQHRIALETSEIYAPLAYRLGLSNIYGDLEDLVFPYLHPEEYKWLKKTMAGVLKKGEKDLEHIESELNKELKKEHIDIVKIDKRVKRLSSLYKKLQRLNMDLEQVHDLIALRIIVKDIQDCYAVLGIIHKLWPPLPGKIKDYIALPKPNGYRSLHTTAFCNDRPTEFQVRTEEMHRENEYGIAAHWAYSEGKKTDKYKEKKAIFADIKELKWINQLKNWQTENPGSEDFLKSLKIEFFQDRIFAITPKGEVIDLPVGATPIDFAYSIHSDIGNSCIGARVNDKIVPLDYQLLSGDVVEIFTQKNRKPTSQWLGYVKTERAKNRIRASIREKDHMIIPKNTEFKITSEDKVGLLKDVTGVFSHLKININTAATHDLKGSKYTLIKISAATSDKDKIDKIILRLKKVPAIKQIEYSTDKSNKKLA